jgi:hypothetical protein
MNELMQRILRNEDTVIDGESIKECMESMDLAKEISLEK